MQSSDAHMIEDKKQTIAEYFKQHHGITLQYPELPCVKVNEFIGDFNFLI